MKFYQYYVISLPSTKGDNLGIMILLQRKHNVAYNGVNSKQ